MVTVARTVGDVARLASVTVRTLHHYDAIGLVSPSGRSVAGYRLYEDADVERLHQVLVYRELGFSLDEIRALMCSPDFDRGHALREQRKLLEAEGERVRAMLAAVDAAIAAHESGETMSDESMFAAWSDGDVREVFGDFDPREHEGEAKQRWGDTDAWRQSAERTRRYTKDDWQAVKAEQEAIGQRYVELYTAGAPATSTEAMDAAEAHRRNISDRFYECSPEMHRGLGEMYVADPRFTATYDAMAPGLALWVRDAIAANADRAGA